MKENPTINKSIQIDIWSDIACPWCYLGKRRFEKALTKLANLPDAPNIEVKYHSYQLHPELPQEFSVGHIEFHARKHGKNLKEVVEANEQLQKLGESYGISYNFEIAIMVNTQKAHEFLHYARAHGREAETREELFKAHFTKGMHIGHIGQLAVIATEVGLDKEDMARSLRNGDYTNAVKEDNITGKENGITDSIPFYVIGGKHKISGATIPSKFIDLILVTAKEMENH